MSVIIENSGERLDHFWAQYSGESRNQVQRKIESGLITVNEVIVRPGYKIKKGDVINEKIVNKSKKIETPPLLSLRYEDQEIMVICKPIGVVVHPGVGHASWTLVDQILAYNPDLKTVGQPDRPGIVHRLDKNTEGLMVIAKTNEAYAHLIQQFQAHTVEKRYYALCHGNIQSESIEVNQPIGRHPQHFNKRWVMPTGKPAKTEFRVIKRYNTKTLVEARPITGRTHQIRVHLAYIKHPIIGDSLYHPGEKKERGGIQALQAFSLGFKHPKTDKILRFQEPKSERLF